VPGEAAVLDLDPGARGVGWMEPDSTLAGLDADGFQRFAAQVYSWGHQRPRSVNVANAHSIGTGTVRACRIVSSVGRGVMAPPRRRLGFVDRSATTSRYLNVVSNR
jgi:hypothetical protein